MTDGILLHSNPLLFWLLIAREEIYEDDLITENTGHDTKIRPGAFNCPEKVGFVFGANSEVLAIHRCVCEYWDILRFLKGKALIARDYHLASTYSTMAHKTRVRRDYRSDGFHSLLLQSPSYQKKTK